MLRRLEYNSLISVSACVSLSWEDILKGEEEARQ